MSNWQKINSLIDNEVSSAERAELESEISSSPELQSHFESAKAVKNVVSKHCAPIGCEATWGACLSRLDEIDKAKRVNGFVGKYAWAICSVFFLVILGAATFNRMTGYKRIRSGDIAQMVSGLAPISVPSRSNSSEMTKWFADQLSGSQVPIQPLALEVTRAARGKVNGHPILCLDMKDGSGPVCLAIVKDAHEVEGTSQVSSSPKYFYGRSGNMNFVTWTEGDYSLLLLSDRPVRNLLPIADAFRVNP